MLGQNADPDRSQLLLTELLTRTGRGARVRFFLDEAFPRGHRRPTLEYPHRNSGAFGSIIRIIDSGGDQFNRRVLEDVSTGVTNVIPSQESL